MSQNDQRRHGEGEPFDETIPEDTIKIMLATDNHIGYLERDPVRGHDAINTFEEILQLAVKHDVDFILLAGDLFHENKPSRESIYRTTALLRKYTMGDRPVQVELLSDPMESKPPGFDFPAINYEDPNYNVGIPVFSIHGNHDDPQGAGQDGALCALDLLSVAGLLNYFGKTDLPTNDYALPAGNGPDGANGPMIDGITIKPVLLRKGRTKLGMYGIGNVKDTRMHFELMHNRVKMWKPKNAKEYCNLLLIHQNRVKHGPNDSVPEGMFDDSINLVIWGHEHDQRIVPEDVAGKRYKITQPGSSVATSLTEGESIPKHVALLRIQGTRYELEPIPLRTVRPFIADDLDLTAEAEEEGIDLTDSLAVMKFIRTKIEKLIAKVKEQWVERMRAAQADDDEEEIVYPKDVLPLIRLRVDTSGVPNMGNPNRIGQEFQGRIANLDPVTYIRAKKSAARKVKADQPELSLDDPDLTPSEKLSRVHVGTLVKEYLAAQELELLGENAMSDAVHKFVDKDDPQSIQLYVKFAMTHLVKNMETHEADGDEDVQEALQQLKEKTDKEYDLEAEKRRQAKAAKKGKGKEIEADRRSVDSMDVDEFPEDNGGFGGSDDEDDSDAPRAKKKTTKAAAKKAPAKTTKAAASKAKAKAPAKSKTKKLFRDSDDDDDEPEEEVVEDDSEEEVIPAPKKRSRADVLNGSAPTTKKAPAKKAAQSTLNFGGSSTAAARGSTRTASTKAKKKIIELSD